jgi:hypothetical protein
MPEFVGDLPIWLWWISILVAPLASIGGVLVSLWLTRERQLRDRLWTARQAAYGRILSALGAASAVLAAMEAQRRARGLAYLSGAEGREARERLRAHFREMARGDRENALILPAPFIDAYSRLADEVAGASLRPADEALARLLAVVPQAQAELVRIARDDLRLGGRRRPRPGRGTPDGRLSRAAS